MNRTVIVVGAIGAVAVAGFFFMRSRKPENKDPRFPIDTVAGKKIGGKRPIDKAVKNAKGIVEVAKQGKEFYDLFSSNGSRAGSVK